MYPIHHPVHTCTVPPILEGFLGSDLGHASPPLQILTSPLWLSLGGQFSLMSPRVIFSLRRFCAHILMSTTTFTLFHIDMCFTYGLCDSLEGSGPFWPRFSEEEKPVCFWWSSYASQSVCNKKPFSGHWHLWACRCMLSIMWHSLLRVSVSWVSSRDMYRYLRPNFILRSFIQFARYFKKFICLSICLFGLGVRNTIVHVEVKGNFQKPVLFFSYVSSGLELSHQAWQQAPLPIEPYNCHKGHYFFLREAFISAGK